MHDQTKADVGIIAALQVELDAILSFMPDNTRVTFEQSDNRTYYRGEVKTSNGKKLQVVTTLLPSMGNVSSALAASDLIRLWGPSKVFVVGIAGGTRSTEQSLGDILVADKIVHYEPQKIRPDGPELRHRILEADPLLYDRALNLQTDDWWKNIPVDVLPDASFDYSPKVHFGPLASGEKVIADIATIQGLQRHIAKLVGVEMESAGVASAAFGAAKHIGFLTVRAISDFADKKKDDRWRKGAAYSAAAWAFELLRSGAVSPQTIIRPLKPVSFVPKALDRLAMLDDITDRLDIEGFKTLCFILGVDIDEMPGNKKSAKVRELLMYFERRKQLSEFSQVWVNFKESKY